MDFMKLLQSVEELLYELVSWLVFYPLTVWRAVVNPLDMMRYADVELEDRPEDQYDDTLSPPLFLLITLLISQALSRVIPTVLRREDLPELLESDSNLLLARGVVFAVIPLVMAVMLLKGRRIRLTRNTLRPPFYSQCYVAAPFVFAWTIGYDIYLMPWGQGAIAGILIMIAAFIWYATAEIRWIMRDLGRSFTASTLLFLTSAIAAAILIVVVAATISLSLKAWSR